MNSPLRMIFFHLSFLLLCLMGFSPQTEPVISNPRQARASESLPAEVFCAAQQKSCASVEAPLAEPVEAHPQQVRASVSLPAEVFCAAQQKSCASVEAPLAEPVEAHPRQARASELSPALLLEARIADAKYKIPLPPPGSLYHGVFPGRLDGSEDQITPADLEEYESAVGKTAAWVYFSHEWSNGTAFPLDTVTWIHDHGSVPYIRLMMRSTTEQNKAEKKYKLQSIVDGAFDKDWRAWCRTAAALNYPLLVEYGTEMNGRWFSWNGVWNGLGVTRGYGDNEEPDGPERFRDAYRYLIDVCRIEGAENISWVFHVNGTDIPESAWNHFENYYPGDDYIDWLAISIYGAQTPFEKDWPDFDQTLESVYNRFIKMGPGKPVIIAEFGMTDNHPRADRVKWTTDAFISIKALAARKNSRLIGFSWWNEAWPNNDKPAEDTNMRVQDNMLLQDVFKVQVADDMLVLGSIPVIP